MVSHLGITVEEKFGSMPQGADLPEFLKLLFDFAKQESLTVSQHSVNAWARILRKEGLRDHPAAQELAPDLVRLCDERLLRVCPQLLQTWKASANYPLV